MKSEGKGDGKFSKQINEAVAQVLRGTNGLIALASKDPILTSPAFLGEDSKHPNMRYAAFFPVIITTAQLWISNTDISQANLYDGNLSSDAIELERRDWLYYQYPQSPDLKHRQLPEFCHGNMSDLLYQEYTRTICVVNVGGLDNFLEHWKNWREWKFENR